MNYSDMFQGGTGSATWEAKRLVSKGIQRSRAKLRQQDYRAKMARHPDFPSDRF